MAVKCFYHKRRDAVGACVHCGKLVCSDCEVTLKKKIYCNPCVEELFGEQPAAVEAEPVAEVTKPAARAPKKPVAVAAAKAEAAEAAAPQVARAKKRTGMWVGLGVGLAFVFIVVPLLLLIIALGGQPEPPTGEWKANPTIKEPLTANIAGQDVVLGDLNKQQVEVKLPGSAFQQAAQVTVRNAKNAPPVPPDEFTPLGAPIEIDTGELPSRLYELATITFKLDRKAMESEPDPGAYWVAHYTGGEWEYVEPDEVNPEEGTISIRTDNFLIFGWGTISVKEYIEEYAKSKAVAKWAQKNVDDKSKKALEMCLSPALKKLGVTDDLTKKLVTSIFTDPECDNLRKGIEEGDMDTITESLGNLLGKNFHTILESRGDDELWLGKTQIKSPLGATIQYAGEVKAIATAAGQAAEGKYQAAAGTLVKDVFSKWVLGSSVPVQVILDLKGAGEELARFLDNRMFEQAYQIYTTGSTYGMGRTQQWAYSDVEKGNFQQVWDQSHYVRRQLIDKFMAMEQDKPANKRLSRREAEDRARNYLEALFNNRQESEVEIAQEEARIKKLINLFKAEALSDPAMRDFMYPWQKGWFSDYRPDRPPKESLDELLRVMGIIKRETGLEPEELVEADLVQLASELIEIRQKIRAGQQEDPFYRSQAYQDTLKKYAAFTITAPQDILEGKGVPGTSYTFTAQIRELPGIFLYYDWYVNGVVEKKDSASRTFPRAFKTPGPYTVKCVAHWREGPKGAQDVVRKEKLAELKFNIAELAELKISVSPAMPSSKGTADINYTFRAQATGAPEGASYQWYKDGQLIAGSEASKTITFTEGTHTVAVKLVKEGKVLAEASTRANITATTPIPPSLPVTLTLSPNPLRNGEEGKTYAFTADATNAPTGSYYRWYGNGKLLSGNASTKTVEFVNAGTHTIGVELVKDNKVIATATAAAYITAAAKVEPEPDHEPDKPQPKEKTPQEICACYNYYVQVDRQELDEFYQRERGNIHKGCKVEQFKPYTYDPSSGRCMGEFLIKCYQYFPAEGVVGWSGGHGGSDVSLGTAKEACKLQEK